MCMRTTQGVIDRLTWHISISGMHFNNTSISVSFLQNGTVWQSLGHDRHDRKMTAEALLPVQVSQAWKPARARTQGSNSTPWAMRHRDGWRDLCRISAAQVLEPRLKDWPPGSTQHPGTQQTSETWHKCINMTSTWHKHYIHKYDINIIDVILKYKSYSVGLEPSAGHTKWQCHQRHQCPRKPPISDQKMIWTSLNLNDAYYVMLFMFIILISVSFCVGGWANDIKKPLKKMIFLRLRKVANTAGNTQLLCEESFGRCNCSRRDSDDRTCQRGRSNGMHKQSKKERIRANCHKYNIIL